MSKIQLREGAKKFGSWLAVLTLVLLSPTAHVYEDDYFGPKSYKKPVRKVAVIAAREGYYPSDLVFFVGEVGHFFLTSTVGRPTCLMIPSLKVHWAVNRGVITEGQIFFRKAGEYDYYCPAGNLKGKITVLSRTGDSGRRPASMSERPSKWMPKDY